MVIKPFGLFEKFEVADKRCFGKDAKNEFACFGRLPDFRITDCQTERMDGSKIL